MMSEAAIKIAGVSKSFARGVPVLKDVSLDIGRGEMVTLIGASGSGKSTLIRSIAGLIPADRNAGRDGCPACGIYIFGMPMQADGRISGAAKSLRARVGIVFQQFNLVPRLSVLTNVCLGLLGQIPAARGTLGLFSGDERRRAIAPAPARRHRRARPQARLRAVGRSAAARGHPTDARARLRHPDRR
jgi:phosphonate transport system ATP-binding protein